MYQMLKALVPSITNIPNRLNGDITTTEIMCYFLFWLLQLPFLFISPQSLRWLFLAKAIIVPPALFAMLGWAFATTGGGGTTFEQKGKLSGFQLAWTWLGAVNSTLGTITTLAVNIPDFTRYARSKQEYVWCILFTSLY
jgi:nucleobase:cation symporter-1, NCS1 family